MIISHYIKIKIWFDPRHYKMKSYIQSMWLWKSLYNLLTRDWWYNELNTVDCFRVDIIMQSIGWKTNNTDRYRQIMTSFQTLLTWLLFVFNINSSVNFHVQNLKNKVGERGLCNSCQHDTSCCKIVHLWKSTTVLES